MPNERNALAELANELERFSAENKGLFARRNHLILHKASRIIAELANVLDERTYGNRTFYLISSADAVEKCRASAEQEGGINVQD